MGEGPRVYYVVRPVGDQWELSFAHGAEPGVLFATPAAALVVADDAARRHWELRHEPCAVRLESPGGAPREGAHYGDDGESWLGWGAHAP